MSKKSFIDSIEVKTPCSEDWGEMKGDEKIRFCSHCTKSVSNISAMTRKQAMRVVRDSKGEICVRFVKNPQTNAPVFAGKLYQITRRAGIAAGVLGASMAISTLTYAQGSTSSIERISGSQIEVSQEKQTEKDKSESKFASISGIVTDPNGAVISFAGLTLTNEETSDLLIIQADEYGSYKFEEVPAGKYKLSIIGGEGFAEKEITDIAVSERGEIRKDVSLNVSEQTASVTVQVDTFTTMGIMASIQSASPLHRAAADNDIEEVKNLIAKGANVNTKDKNYDNITPLFLAVENGNVEMVETLLNAGAKINARDKNKQTPLMRLDEDATAELVRVLITHGAKVNGVDGEGNTALILAAHTAKAEALQVLIDHDAQINAQNKQGQTALMNAADADNLESVRALLLAGADVNLKNKDGETAWDLTASDEIEELLKSNGAIVEEN
jgi:hypothetical protein